MGVGDVVPTWGDDVEIDWETIRPERLGNTRTDWETIRPAFRRSCVLIFSVRTYRPIGGGGRQGRNYNNCLWFLIISSWLRGSGLGCFDVSYAVGDRWGKRCVARRLDRSRRGAAVRRALRCGGPGVGKGQLFDVAFGLGDLA